MTQYTDYQVDDRGVARLTLNRPEVHNAFDDVMIAELIAALEQLGRYYHQGTLVQKDVDRAILYLREAASLGNIPAQLRLADILIAGQGSPYDFKNAYQWLHQSITADETTYQAIEQRMDKLAQRMPPSVVEEAKSPLN